MAFPTPETRTFAGETGTMAIDRFPGFQTGQSYRLRYEQRPDKNISIELEEVSARGLKLIVTSEQWAKWFEKV
ncbi:MAG: hypothetical protein ACRYFZ_01570 [Janthinobacterium lividum]